MSEINYFRLIEAYFEGTISPNEKAMLEAKIESDPLVKAEFDLQKNIIQGIANTRKLELKSRLASIDLPTTAGVLGGSGVKWLAGTITGVTLFGSVLYWSLYNFNEVIKPLDINVAQAMEFKSPKFDEIPTVQREITSTPKNIAEKPSSIELVEEKIKEEERKENTAKVKPQSLISYEDDKIFSEHNEEEIENISSKDIALNRADKTEIQLFEGIDSQDNFHYRYYNSKLYLYGDFKKMPYQIIELNDKGRKQLFLSYNQDVFIIKDNTTDITPLSKLDDELLKMEIDLILED
ncbi:anti-sigma factor [Marivirga arenosa]|uniref:Zinc-finger domain-containing protein n=1 Tax=Marivirga arenosa TaxID=3059076 RepID=A0AA51X414_9BACT|nr:hypothetical protein [Marivirga sp. BKB1-2]WNB17124.1 hypothetical protein QYS47_33005 [Marivirga sp. BKB1-2]